MIVKYGYRRYEMTIGRAFSFKLQKLWFPWRRFLRAVKRCLLSLRSWAPVLAVFIPIAVLVLLILFRVGLISAGGAIVEFALIFLGSFMLLAIREIREKESVRHRRLVNQWNFCSDLHQRMGKDLAVIGEPFGASFTYWKALSGYKSLDEAMENARELTGVTEEEFSRLIGACDDLERALDSVRDEGRGIGFVDCALADDSTSLLFCAESAVHDFKDKLRGADYPISADVIGDINRYCLWIVGDLRTPWRYTLDITRGELLEKYVERNGAEM